MLQILEIIELFNAFFKNVFIILAVPSAVLRAILPVKPSVITTFVTPFEISLPSIKP
jgi:hypothetical protein